jgi:apolipoprotein N-acyltransferase
LCFPHADFGFLAWIALVPFFATFPKKRLKDALLHGLILGIVYYGGVLYWMGVFASEKAGVEIGAVSAVLAPLVHSSVTILFSGLAFFLWKRPLWMRLAAIPSAWALSEWIGELGPLGLGWADLGYSQWRDIPILQIASIGGVFGIGFLIVLFNLALASKSKKAIIGALALLVICFAWGISAAKPPHNVDHIRVAAIQGNINQDVPWNGHPRPENPSDFYNPLTTFGNLLHDAAGRGATFAALPETALPGYVCTDSELLFRAQNWTKQSRIAFLTGARYTDIAAKQDQNVVFLFDPTGSVDGPYAKTKLVPFGEYLPYPSIFWFLGSLRQQVGDLEPGAENQQPLICSTTTSSGRSILLKVGSMICFESAYSRFARRQARRGADILCVVTDDTWFGRTAAANQHLAMSAMRAAETHRALVRSAATGISAIFDSRGRLIQSVGLFQQGAAIADAPIETDQTLYNRYGDWLVFVFLGAVLTALLVRMFDRS